MRFTQKNAVHVRILFITINLDIIIPNMICDPEDVATMIELML